MAFWSCLTRRLPREDGGWAAPRREVSSARNPWCPGHRHDRPTVPPCLKLHHGKLPVLAATARSGAPQVCFLSREIVFNQGERGACPRPIRAIAASADQNVSRNFFPSKSIRRSRCL